jgi:pSer/pThr/pTyr-binding forkhead associated (FHA) protein
MVTEGIHAGEVIEVNGVCLLIGRGPQCHVRPNSPAISQRHCAFLVREERVFLRDLGSKTGTYLNDRQLRGEIELQDGDMLRMGPLTFVIQIESDFEEPNELAVPAASTEPSGERTRPVLDETVDLTCVDEDAPVPLAPETQIMPALEPCPAPPGFGNGWADPEEYAALLPAAAGSHNGVAPAVSAAGNGTTRTLTNRARLTRILRAPRRPPT